MIPKFLAAVPHAARMARKMLARGRFGHRRYSGDAVAICRQIVRDNWNGIHFQGSAGHFSQLWIRDLGMCAEALVRLGWGEEVRRSLEWALPIYEAHGSVTTTIFAGGKAIDIYEYGSDSLPFLMRAIRVSEAFSLAHRYRAFLGREVQRYRILLMDEKTGLARKEISFSAAKDCMRGESTVYANSMMGLLSSEIAHFPEIPNPFAGEDIAGRLIERSWRGDHFVDDASGRDLVSGDANVWPFWTGLVASLDMRRSAFGKLEEMGFTEPIPLRYYPRRHADLELAVPRLFTPNYQGDTAWTQIGPVFIGLQREVDPARAAEHLLRYRGLIERFGNYLELFTPDERPYVGRFGLYRADEGMIWAALFLDLAT